MDPAANEQLYQVYQDTYNKTAQAGPSSMKAVPGGGYPPPSYPMYPNSWQSEPYTGADLDFPVQDSYNNGYMNHMGAGYYPPQQPISPYDQQHYSQPHLGPPTNAQFPGSMPQWNETYTPQLPPASKIKTESSTLDDALNVLQSHASSPTPTAGFGSQPSPYSPSVASTEDFQRFTPQPPVSPSPSSLDGSDSKPRKAGGPMRGKRRSKTSEGGEEGVGLDPQVRQVKEKERRHANNSRERMRIRDINDALNELGRVCMQLKPKGADKPQTKLSILNLAVDVISNLESKVREKNLNPSALCTVNRAGGFDHQDSSSNGPASSSSDYNQHLPR